MSSNVSQSRFSRVPPPHSSNFLTNTSSGFAAPTPPAPRYNKPTASSRIVTPLAPPPPPLSLADPAMASEGRRMRFAGAEHTLGPTFSDEEDGDDSAWIASKMAVLGLDPNGQPYTGAASKTFNSRNTRDSTAIAPAQSRQQAWPASVDPQAYRSRPDHYTSAMAPRQQAQQQHQQAQAQALLYAQAQRALLVAQLQQPHSDPYGQYSQQAQIAALQQLQQPAQTFVSAFDQRSALAAQVQANLLARTQRSQLNLNDTDLRARFESAPNVVDGSKQYQTPQTNSKPVFENTRSPYGDVAWRSFSPKVNTTSANLPPTEPSASSATPRFTTAAGGNLATFLSRRRATDETSLNSESDSASISTVPSATEATTGQTSPNASFYEEKSAAQTNLGHGRPINMGPSSRAQTVPQQSARAQAPFARAASHAGVVSRCVAVRQPHGPPGEVSELGERNFQSRIRRQAGLNLGMLGRRTETPPIAE